MYSYGLDFNSNANLNVYQINATFFKSQVSNIKLVDSNTNTVATFDTNGSTINSNLTTNEVSLNKINFKLGTSNYNYINVDATNKMYINVNNVNVLNSDGTTTNITTDINSSTSSLTKTLTLESSNSLGSSTILLKSRGTNTCTIQNAGPTGLFIQTEQSIPMTFKINSNSGTPVIPIQCYTNGVVNVSNGNTLANKMLVLFDSGSADAASNATNYYGFGVNSNTLRYQTTLTTATHKFYCGATLGFTITNTGGSPTSDIRFKSDIQNLSDSLTKINGMQPKNFIMYGDTSKRQIGFIAQELIEILPEAVVVDDSDENHYMSIQYDKITSLLCQGIKDLLSKVTSLEARIIELENKIV